MVNNKAYRGHALRTVVVTMLVLLLAGSAGAKTNISSCTTISSPGEYVLNTDLSNSTDCIKITSSNVTFDGAGHSITGPSSPSALADGVMVQTALVWPPLKNVTVKNLNVTNWDSGIDYFNVENGSITNNIVSNNIYGISLGPSNNITVSHNNATGNGIGIVLQSNNSMLIGNNASNNYAIKGAGGTGTGISLVSYSSYNNLSGNTANSNTLSGIFLYQASYNNLSGNNANSNNYSGIELESFSNYNMLKGNTVNSNNNNGIDLSVSNNNTLIGNTVNSNNNRGIFILSNPIFPPNYNTLKGNNVSNNNVGIYLYNSSNNIIYNNFFNNTNNSAIFNSVNIWNTTKTSGTNIVGGTNLGGNVWAYPNGTGFSQTCADSNSDGICDSPYTLNANNTDYIPLAAKTLPLPPKPVKIPGFEAVLFITMLLLAACIRIRHRR